MRPAPFRSLSHAFAAALILVCCLAGLGCTPSIPDKVTSEEIGLYREWLKHRFADKAPEQLYLDDQTFAFDPLAHLGCGNAMHKEDHVPWSLMKALQALGNADFEVDVSPNTMQLPWPYHVLNPRQFPTEARGLHVVGFSRVALNHNRTEALFAFSDACAFGQCGGGGAVFASKQGGAWHFNQMKSCSWLY